jgi:hypothetical protein
MCRHRTRAYVVSIPTARRGHRSSSGRLTAAFEIDLLEITAGGDVAFAHALLRCGTEEQLADNPDNRLRLTLGLRNEDGRWVVAHERSFPIADDNPDDVAIGVPKSLAVHGSGGLDLGVEWSALATLRRQGSLGRALFGFEPIPVPGKGLGPGRCPVQSRRLGLANMITAN